MSLRLCGYYEPTGNVILWHVVVEIWQLTAHSIPCGLCFVVLILPAKAGSLCYCIYSAVLCDVFLARTDLVLYKVWENARNLYQGGY